MAFWQYVLLVAALIVEAHSLPATFCGDKPNGVYADPSSCSSFWACWNDGLKGSLLLCPPNTLWSQSSLSCTHITPPSSTPSSSPAASASASTTSIASPTSFNTSSLSSSNSTSPPLNASSTTPTPASPTSLNTSSLSSSSASPSLNSSSTTPFFSPNSSASSNSSMETSFPPSCSSSSLLHLPIWSWNGLLHCYGYGCLDTQKPNLPNQFAIGIPCLAAQELVSIAQCTTQAWIPAPHQFFEGDLNLAEGKHWKVRFDSLKKEAESGLTLLKASITDFSPSQKIVDTWQGGPREAQFALEGPQTSAQGDCFYSLSLESPELGDMWEPFAKDLIKESMFKQKEVRVGSMQQALQAEGDSFGWVHKKMGGNKRRVHASADTVQGCLRVIPWASLVATALCYASNTGGGLNSVALCSDIPSPDLFSIAKCFASFLGIGSELGL